MFDSEIIDIFTQHRRVLDETNEVASLRLNKESVELVVFDGDKLREMHTAYLYNDMPEATKRALRRISDALVHMLKGGAVDV